MEKIKLVIWDLDETFWKGTISDGDVEPIPENIELVKTLTDRGIVNSICSKNDHEVAKNELIKEGIWDHFVFPSIDWTAKGLRVKQIIEDMNLRPVNVIFVDDNINNLKEAAFITEGLQTALPEELAGLTGDEAFKGKDDSDHSRLKQYKILETKTEAKKNSSSNEEFLYQSEINVELVEDCSDKLERIHEMIHRNNQLNYTKDRISEDEVKRIFTDPNIRSGYVKVKDKYGDHGIVGCYAVENGKALQLVLSCRILGMGVEQWLYSELGYPELEVVGEVASELKKDERPGWINQGACPGVSSDENPGVKKSIGKFIAYGTCPLRPVWGYIEPQLEDARFAEIDPGPSVCNLSAIIREPEEKIQEWLDNIKLFDSRYSFDKDIISDETSYILITLDGESDTYKYAPVDPENGDGGCFYIKRVLNSKNASGKILESYKGSKLTFQELESEISFFLDNIQEGTELLLMTVPEVVFPGVGEDDNYRERLELNKVAERLAQDHSNVHLIDIRKYAKSPADFFDTVSNHYNRAIGNSIAREILDYIGKNAGEDKNSSSGQISNIDNPPEYALKKEIAPEKDRKGTLTVFIRNGTLAADYSSDNTGDYEYFFTFVRDRFIESRTEWTESPRAFISVNKLGRWRVNLMIRRKGEEEPLLSEDSDGIDYSSIRFLRFFDRAYTDYEISVEGTDQFVNDIEKAEKVTRSNIRLISELGAVGINPAQYFLEKGIHEITLFTDTETGEALLPYLRNSDLGIKTVYTTDLFYENLKNGLDDKISVQTINGELKVSGNDNVLFAYNNDQVKLYMSLFEARGAKIHYLNKVLCMLKTGEFLSGLGKKISPKIFAVRTGSIARFYQMPYRYIKSKEKELEKLNDRKVYKLVKNKKSLPEVLSAYDTDYLAETMEKPSFKTDKARNIQVMKDVSGRYLNITDGRRVTTDTPDHYYGTIYVLGGIIAFGCGCSDDKTIVSFIQRNINSSSPLPYRVVNMANTWGITDFSSVLSLMEKIPYGEHDIVVLMVSNWRHELVAPRPHWFEWDAVAEPVKKIDAFPLFADAKRENYFTSQTSYNEKANEKIAEKVSKELLEHILNAESEEIIRIDKMNEYIELNSLI